MHILGMYAEKWKKVIFHQYKVDELNVSVNTLIHIMNVILKY